MEALEENETMMPDLSDVDWEQKVKRGYNNKSPIVRIVQYSTQAPQIGFNSNALDMILGRQQKCHIVLGLSRDRKDLYIKMADAEDEGSRLLQRTKTAAPPKWNVPWLGAKLGLTGKNCYAGELVLMNRDMFIVELIESDINSNKSHPKAGRPKKEE